MFTRHGNTYICKYSRGKLNRNKIICFVYSCVKINKFFFYNFRAKNIEEDLEKY